MSSPDLTRLLTELADEMPSPAPSPQPAHIAWERAARRRRLWGAGTGVRAWRRRITLALVAVAVVVVTAPSAAYAAVALGLEPRHASGLAVVRSHYLFNDVPEPVPEQLSVAFTDVLHWLTIAYPNDFGYPWIDRRSWQLVIDVVTPLGEQLATNFRQPRAPADTPTRIRPVTHSYAELQRVLDAVGPGIADLPDAGAVYMSAPDPEHNRILYGVTRLSSPLLYGLAGRFGTDAIAIEFDPSTVILGTTASGAGDGTGIGSPGPGRVILSSAWALGTGFPLIGGIAVLVTIAMLLTLAWLPRRKVSTPGGGVNRPA